MRAPAIAALIVLLVAPRARGDAPSGDPGRGRYLVAPSAFLLRGGELVFSQREALLSTAALGIADHAEVTLGSAMPALSLFGANAMNLDVGVKAGLPIHERVRVAVGFESLSFSGATVGYVFGVATVGSERVNLSAGAGIPTAIIQGSPSFGPTGAFLAGTLGLGRHVALATENWWFPASPQLSMVNAGMVRLTAWRLSLGLGAARIAPLRIPLPWIDLAVRVRG